MQKKVLRPFLFRFYVLLFLLFPPLFSLQLSAEIEIRDGDYDSAILINADTGEVLYEKNAHDPHPPASMVKMMLMLLVMEKIEEQSISLADPVTTSAKASKYGGSQVYLKHGEIFSLEEMMKAIAIHSANDASVAVAEYLTGSVDGCVDLMNRRAGELGMKETIYYSVDGLPPGRGDKPDLSSAHDLALLARELVKYPKILEWGSTKSAPFRQAKFTLTNTNKLIGIFPGADGLKTGYYRKAGYNLTATASRDGLRVISVVLGSSSEKGRARESARLLSIGFNMYTKVRAVQKGEPVSQEVNVTGARVKSTILVASKDLFLHVRRGAESLIHMELSALPEIAAPIYKGKPYGEIVVKNGEKELARVDAIAQEEIEEAPFLYRLFSDFF